MGKLSKRIAALQAELRKRGRSWGEEDDVACAAAIRDIVAGRPPSKRMRPIVARRAERAGAEIRELLDAAMASVQGPPPDEERAGDPADPDPDREARPPAPPAPGVAWPDDDDDDEPIEPASPDPEQQRPTRDVGERFDEMGRA